MTRFVRPTLFVLVALSFLLAACGTPATPVTVVQTQVVNQVVTATPDMSQPTPLPAGSVQINGAGSTFQQPAMSDWAYAYPLIDPSVVINYQGVGSGAGKKAIIGNTVDFAGSDSVLTADETTQGKDLQIFPILAGAVVIMYNIPELDPTKDPVVILNGQALVDIYNGKVTKWNDPEITALNPQIAAKLPAKQITVVHRSDGSGTTEIFTNALTAFSSDWTAGHGTTVDWPADKTGNGIGGKGSQGVSAVVQNTPYAIGYVEYSFAKANGISFAQMVNKAGKTVTAGPDSVASAMNDFANAFTPALTAVIVNGGGDGSWPITGYTYDIIHTTSMTDCVKAQKMLEFFHWFLTDPSATKRATALGFVPLPDAVLQQVEAALGKVTCNGQPVTIMTK
ncbi:MAG TPA: phosphate ABC transporter substrate-binding protein PstS [Anaerolineales bacterium]|nr:phosphate ABC transporter substrate-binding protein PstS [Anaerolineales bacterium]